VGARRRGAGDPDRAGSGRQRDRAHPARYAGGRADGGARRRRATSWPSTRTRRRGRSPTRSG
jgi:hypothetical protein